MRCAGAAVMGMVVLIGCRPAGVDWDAPVSAPSDTTGSLAVQADRAMIFPTPPTPGGGVPPDTARCPGTLATAIDGGTWYAAWLSRRGNGSVLVRASRSGDSGRTWSLAGIVDSVDVGRTGCAH